MAQADLSRAQAGASDPGLLCTRCWPSEVLKGDISAGFTIDLAHKDLSLILEAANRARLPLPVAAAAREMFSVAPCETVTTVSNTSVSSPKA